MIYAKLSVKTANGWQNRYYKFDESWKFGRHLCRHYKDKEYSWHELTEDQAEFLNKYTRNKIDWKLIDYIR